MHQTKMTGFRSRRLALLISSGLMATWLLTACGGGSDPTPTTVPAVDTPAAVATNTPEPAPTDTPAPIAPTKAAETEAVTTTHSMTATHAVTVTNRVTATGDVMATGSTTSTEPLAGIDEQTQPEVVTINLSEDAKLGTLILVDGDGMTLYLFDKDTIGKSNCTDNCLETWPPVLVEDNDAILAGEGVIGELDVIAAADGLYQAVYGGHPLYYYAKDTKPGETNGAGVGDAWWVVGVDGNAVHPQ